MSRNKNIVLDIEINAEKITSRINTLILISVIRHLSFFRNQIPLPFETYKSLLDAKMRSAVAKPPADGYKSYCVERELQQAQDTLNKLDAIAASIETCDRIKQAVILFGATITTPREIYEINLPNIDSETVNETVIHSAVQSFKIRFSTANELNLKPINQTNMFLALQRPNVGADVDHLFQPNAAFIVPSRCATRVVVNLRKTEATICRNISIFNDLSLNEVGSRIPEVDDQWLVWYESSVHVKGFKQTFEKGVPIWDMAIK